MTFRSDSTGTNGTSRTPTAKRFYSVIETAALLGISAPTLYREIRAGRFPAITVRGRYVIPAKAIDALEQAAIDAAQRHDAE